MSSPRRPVHLFLLILGLLAFVSLACTFSLFEPGGSSGQPGAATQTPPPSVTPVALAETTFIVTLPAPLNNGETLALVIVDDVTGIALNARSYAMSPQDATHYIVTLPLPQGEIVKYRYARISTLTIYEDNFANELVRYRMLRVDGPGQTEDIISSWSDQPFQAEVGAIRGQVTDAATGQPLPNILLEAGGVQVISDARGYFAIEGLPPGTHRLTAYAMDGQHDFFQQGAVVAANAITEVPIQLTPRPLVNVTFLVTVPENTVQGAPLRIAGDLLQLGNIFADLDGGINTLASAMPVLVQQPDGRYALTLQLPAGAGIHYKYTLGDGFWNAEHNADGAFALRFLRVPSQNTTIEDTIYSWQNGSNAPILFDVTVPENTPAEDILYLQLNPYGWMEPIPMWPMGNNRWTYKLYSPLDLVGNFGYRYCRNGQCGLADDAQTPGPTPEHARIAKTSLVSQHLTDTINRWANLESFTTQLTARPIQPMAPGFITGVEFLPAYKPSWQPHLSSALGNVAALNANWLVLTPSWTMHNSPILALNQDPKRDMLLPQETTQIQNARALGLNVAVFPQANLPAPTPNWWIDAPRSPDWWQAWFEAYRIFALHHAQAARDAGAQMLILGGEWVTPALPGGQLATGEPSGVPADAEARWRSILQEAGETFGGPVFWAMPYDQQLSARPPFLDAVAGVYLLWSAPIGPAEAPSQDEMIVEIVRQLDEVLKPFSDEVGKPIVIAAAYPSAPGAAAGCIAAAQGYCLSWEQLSPPYTPPEQLTPDLTLQREIYEALLIAINQRPWVGGFVSRGYYPPAILHDVSASVHGKPAADVLWYWYPRLNGSIQE